MGVTEIKKCTRCGEVKPVDKFYRSSNSTSGRLPECKKCRAKLQKEWREKNPVAHAQIRVRHWTKKLARLEETTVDPEEGSEEIIDLRRARASLRYWTRRLEKETNKQ